VYQPRCINTDRHINETFSLYVTLYFGDLKKATFSFCKTTSYFRSA